MSGRGRWRRRPPFLPARLLPGMHRAGRDPETGGNRRERVMKEGGWDGALAFLGIIQDNWGKVQVP